MPALTFDVNMFWDMGHYYIILEDEQGEEYLLAHGEDQRTVEREASSLLRRLAEKIEKEDD